MSGTNRRGFLSATGALLAFSPAALAIDTSKPRVTAENEQDILIRQDVMSPRDRAEFHLREYMAAMELAYGPFDEWTLSQPDDKKYHVYVIGYRQRES